MSNQNPFIKTMRRVFVDEGGRLRSGWRLLIFVVAFLITGAFLITLIRLALSAALVYTTTDADEVLDMGWGYVVQGFVMLAAATLVGWACGRWLEGLPWSAVGWTRHHGWLRDLLVGSVLGACGLMLAALLATAAGGFRFAFAPTDALFAIAQTAVVAALIFVLSAAAGEAAFRGYPLQTLLRSLPAWAALIPSSLLFASIHLMNPNVARGFTFINTVLAGIWLAVAYVRTRSLWFPLGLHWSWNWTMGALLGLPVSGITEVAPAPLLRATDFGPAWLTGGSYGLEGGLACTLALVISTLFISRTSLVSKTDERQEAKDMQKEEQPVALLNAD
jgi:hypothetical protein